MGNIIYSVLIAYNILTQQQNTPGHNPITVLTSKYCITQLNTSVITDAKTCSGMGSR